jgi:glucosamine-6-phosphate isomerase
LEEPLPIPRNKIIESPINFKRTITYKRSNVRIHVAEDFEAMSHAAADDFIEWVARIRRPLICLPSGRSPVSFLKIIRGHYQRADALPDWYFVGLDEWVGIGEHEQGSCRRFFDDHLFRPLGVGDERISFFNGLSEDLAAECRRTEKFIADHGGIDICVLGIGTNGHLGLNEPGADREAFTQVSTLAPSTIEAAQDYFDRPRLVTRGITLGLSALLSSRHILLLAGGSSKADIIRKVVEDPVTPDVPGSWLQEHPSTRIYLDGAAAASLTQ